MARKKLQLEPQALLADTPEAEYWRGYMAMTANVIYKPGHEPRINIEVPAEDFNHLVALKQFLKSEHAIVLYRNSARLSFASQPLAIELYECGLVRRPYAVKKPVKDRSIDFWRGVVDGGGCIGVYRGYPRLQLVGEDRIVSGLADFIDDFLGRRANVRDVRDKKAVAWTGQSAEHILHHFYGGIGTANMRKQMKVAKILRPEPWPQKLWYIQKV